ncbi:UNVERIFIED_CONTAM: hypothetical protein FKN15_033276 [Acipenser sinensis]
MHEFLRRREEEVKRDLKAAERRALEPMERNLQRIQRELGDRTEQARKLQDSQSITQPVTYLKWWSETGAPLLMELQEESPEDAGAELEEPAKQTTGKIGVYLDYDRGEVAFYNADDMSLIHTVTEKLTEPVSAYLNPGPYLKGKNADPLKICYY